MEWVEHETTGGTGNAGQGGLRLQKEKKSFVRGRM